MEKELTEEQKKYLGCFKAAMEAVDEEMKAIRKKGGRPNPVYRSLVREGCWRADWVAFEFVLAYAGKSDLPKAKRDYILSVGALAKEIMDKSEDGKDEADRVES